jgi:hypothetical protein
VSFAAKQRSKVRKTRKRNGLLSAVFGKRETYHSRIVRAGDTSSTRRTKQQRVDEGAGVKSDVIEALAGLGMARGTAKAKVNEKYKSGDSFDALFRRVVSRSNPGTFKRKRNPESSAAELSEQFHGRPAHTVDEYADELHVHSVLTELGDLIEMTVETESGYGAELDFAKEGLKLASSEDGKQLFVQGRTDLDLAALHMSGSVWERDLMVIGRITSLVYRTAKEYDGGKVTDYIHASGEENVGGKHKRTTDVFPVLLYDLLNHELQIAGGQMEVKNVGIVR